VWGEGGTFRFRTLRPSTAQPLTPSPCTSARPATCRAGFLESGGIYDPLNYAAGKDINRLRSVELKNGRICMLATLGYVVQETYSWPNTQGYFDGSNPIATFGTVPVFGVLQIIGVIALIETQTGNEWQRGAPGDIGFDPLGLAKDGVNPAYADAELKHCRLAMVGWLGFCLQSLVTGKGVLATTFDAFQ